MNWCGYACACGCGQRCECGHTQDNGEPLPFDEQQVRIEQERAQDDKRRRPPWPMHYDGEYHGTGFAPRHPAAANVFGQVPVLCRTEGCVFALGHDRRPSKFTFTHNPQPTPHSFELKT